MVYVEPKKRKPRRRREAVEDDYLPTLSLPPTILARVSVIDQMADPYRSVVLMTVWGVLSIVVVHSRHDIFIINGISSVMNNC